MRRPLLPLALSLLLSLPANHTLASHAASEPSDGTVHSFRWLDTPPPVSTVEIQQYEGQRISLAHFKGKVVLLNLWASWCPPCVRELPALDRLQQRFVAEGLEVVAVSIDSDPSLARQMFNERLTLEHLTLYTEPADSLGRYFPVDVLPSSFIINRDGQAMSVLRSYVDWDAPSADQLIQRVLDGANAATLKAEQERHKQAHR